VVSRGAAADRPDLEAELLERRPKHRVHVGLRGSVLRGGLDARERADEPDEVVPGAPDVRENLLRERPIGHGA
jgi:hypothetical protein